MRKPEEIIEDMIRLVEEAISQAKQSDNKEEAKCLLDFAKETTAKIREMLEE